jgi:hypothetical protein
MEEVYLHGYAGSKEAQEALTRYLGCCNFEFERSHPGRDDLKLAGL